MDATELIHIKFVFKANDMFLHYCTATTDEELAQILTLQQANHASSLSKADAARDGFVTVMHSFELLKKMNQAAPQIIAKDGEAVVGQQRQRIGHLAWRLACKRLQVDQLAGDAMRCQ